MSVRKQRVTPLGWKIKRRLAELELTHKEFCAQHEIPLSRLSEIISGTRKNRKYRDKILRELEIEEEDQPHAGQMQHVG
ncbi:hypothetical protein [Parageobacillus thermoglucosidasius]|uniref:Rha family transcriptional regulator n=3 Tax=Anoxybacillaceae TaxID=3120669 RepID=A0AB38QUI6_PARTM|nr:hypothetical protein [Parageobacillus thermoglucosidasius]AEH47901.1 hypothetical protein Geoth_1942 [Parageobacillus thermoglucosidasius C56-YS93]ALF10860.1 hypothetical protein AOT13_13015 [Parageobacillus thermoglucosidasius]ANZ30937.1 hypothetical protein BCV53_13025 [Parageobacillus thermoglucosidasius]APM81674.1 hypothetical protein BCV54_13035 [Parageobacillus thermoglucosidasius]KJX67529.1 hypothetical protein WH82_17035 [Parageobacillus thermoglucosidasius]